MNSDFSREESEFFLELIFFYRIPIFKNVFAKAKIRVHRGNRAKDAGFFFYEMFRLTFEVTWGGAGNMNLFFTPHHLSRSFRWDGIHN